MSDPHISHTTTGADPRVRPFMTQTGKAADPALPGTALAAGRYPGKAAET
jgi:hypothetical protein